MEEYTYASIVYWDYSDHFDGQEYAEIEYFCFNPDGSLSPSISTTIVWC